MKTDPARLERKSIDAFDPAKLGYDSRGNDLRRLDGWPELLEVYAREGVLGVVVYENHMLDSSDLGSRRAIAYGTRDGLTCRTMPEVLEKYPVLDNELASTIKIPVCYIEKELEDASGPDAAADPAG